MALFVKPTPSHPPLEEGGYWTAFRLLGIERRQVGMGYWVLDALWAFGNRTIIMKEIEEITSQEYKYGFTTDVETEVIPMGVERGCRSTDFIEEE